MPSSIERQLQKLHLNSELPLVGNTTLQSYDPALAEKITETGKTILREMLEKFEDTDAALGEP